MRFPRSISPLLFAVWAIVTLASMTPRLESSGRKDAAQYGAGLIVNLPASEAEVVQAVKEVAQNGIIRGSKEYNKDEYIGGATEASDSRLFAAWTDGGKVSYKVRLHAVDPRNFKDSGDVGTLAVRYIVMGQDEKSTVLRIDAVFVEDFRHTVHASNGSVEGAEYKTIHDHLEAMELIKQEGADAEKKKEESVSERFLEATSDSKNDKALGVAIPSSGTSGDVGPANPGAASTPQTLEQRVKQLRNQTERMVKAPGAPLKSAPFHDARNLESLPSGTEVLIVIQTLYWFGVETHDGQHGWVLRDDLEELP